MSPALVTVTTNRTTTKKHLQNRNLLMLNFVLMIMFVLVPNCVLMIALFLVLHLLLMIVPF